MVGQGDGGCAVSPKVMDGGLGKGCARRFCGQYCMGDKMKIGHQPEVRWHLAG